MQTSAAVVSEYVEGVLKRVMVAVLLVVPLAFVGLFAGFELDMFFPSNYNVGDALVLPAQSPHSASDLARMTRDDHPGVLVVAGRRSISFSATGSLGDANRAVALANRAVIAANNGKIKTILHGTSVRVPSGRYVLLCLLAGLSAALGFLVPPRSRVTAVRKYGWT